MSNRTLWVDYLRSFITVLVVAHHATLAYTTFAYFDKDVYINSTHPVVDEQRWIGLDIFSSFNDTFFMALIFLIGGLFLVRSISKKGVGAFTLDRFYRLLIPFLLLGTVLMLLAYLPAFYLSKGSFDISSHIADFFTTKAWPVGPLWLLFAFNLVFALTFSSLRQLYPYLGKQLVRLQKSPIGLFGFWWLLTIILYVPMAMAVGAGTWTGIGPFDFQLSRLFLYSGYFFLGVVVGTILFFLSGFKALIAKSSKWWNSLSENAYLIYLLHYAFITWSQFLLLEIKLSPGLKFGIVFGIALGGSWWLSHWLRKINIIRKYL